MNESDVVELEKRVTNAWLKIGLGTFQWIGISLGVLCGITLIGLWKMDDLYMKSQQLVTIQQGYFNDLRIIEYNIERAANKVATYKEDIRNHTRELNRYYFAFTKVQSYQLLSLIVDWIKRYSLWKF